jgi:hypothetical protein
MERTTMKNFNLRWGIYKKKYHIKDTDKFEDHAVNFVNWCQSKWSEWALAKNKPRWRDEKERNGKFNEWLELVYKVNT